MAGELIAPRNLTYHDVATSPFAYISLLTVRRHCFALQWIPSEARGLCKHEGLARGDMRKDDRADGYVPFGGVQVNIGRHIVYGRI